jgi:hypothetical protein
MIETKRENVIDKTDYITYKRSEGKHKLKYKSKSLYDFYIKSLPSSYKRTDYNVKTRVYTKILRRVSELIIEAIILDNFEYTLPYRMGKLFVYKRKIKYKLDNEGNLIKKSLPIDFQATKKLWLEDSKAKEVRQKVYHTNDHSDGYKYYFHWRKKDIVVKAFYYYALKPIRRNNRYLAKCVKENQNLDFFDCTYTKN